MYIFQAFFYILFLNSAMEKVKYSYFIYLFLSIFLGIGIIILFTYLFSLNNKNIFMNVKSKILVFILLITPFIFSIFCLDNITSYINYVYLNDVNELFIMISFMIAVFYLIKNDIFSFFRCSTLMFYFYILLEIITFFLLLFYVDFNNLLPFMSDLELSINNSYLFLIFLISPILFLLFIPKKIIDNNKKIGKNIFLTYLVIGLIIIIKSFLSVAVLGYSSLGAYNYPDVIIYKNINLFSFIERIEWLLSFNTITDMFFLISLALFYVKEGLNYILPLKKNIDYLYPLIICILIVLGSYVLTINYVNLIYLFILFGVMHFTFALFSLIK